MAKAVVELQSDGIFTYRRSRFTVAFVTDGYAFGKVGRGNVGVDSRTRVYAFKVFPFKFGGIYRFFGYNDVRAYGCVVIIFKRNYAFGIVSACIYRFAHDGAGFVRTCVVSPYRSRARGGVIERRNFCRSVVCDVYVGGGNAFERIVGYGNRQKSRLTECGYFDFVSTGIFKLRKVFGFEHLFGQRNDFIASVGIVRRNGIICVNDRSARFDFGRRIAERYFFYGFRGFIVFVFATDGKRRKQNHNASKNPDCCSFRFHFFSPYEIL